MKRGDLVYKTDKYVYNFQQYEKIRSLKSAGEIIVVNADGDQSNLLNEFSDFKKETKPRDIEKKR